MKAPRIDPALAEQAAHWVGELSRPRRQEGTQVFVEWIKSSRAHLGEFIAASELAAALRCIDPDLNIDVDGLLARAHTNVRPISPQVAVCNPKPRVKRVRRKVAKERLVLTPEGVHETAQCDAQ